MTEAAAPGPLRGGGPTRSRTGVEVLIVLGLSLGQSAVYSVLSIVDRLTRPEALSSQTSTLNSSVTPGRPWLDLSYQLVNIAFPLVPVVLALYLLGLNNPYREPRSWRTIGFDLHRPGRTVLTGTLIAAGIGIPGLGLYLLARTLGLNTTVQASGLAEVWWTVPVLILSAAENAVLEEVIMLGFLFTRFAELGWRWPVIVASSALIRGSYHLYQGFGGFVGNLIMGLIFGLLFTRTKRVMPFVIAHTLLDIAAFIGYAVLAPHVNWL